MRRAGSALWWGVASIFAVGALSARGNLTLAIGAKTQDIPVASASRYASAPPGVKAELWQVDTEGRIQSKKPLPADMTTPLGSVWKLFVYDYLVSNNIPEMPYVCRGQQRDEVYCCEPGQQVLRDEALIKSCGLYFAPQRLAITQSLWARHWPAETFPSWLHDLDRLQPATEVSVQSLLNALAHLPSQAQARQVLLDRTLQAVGADTHTGETEASSLAATLGSRLRVKTWSWHAPQDEHQRVGGFAGWLADGTPLWARGSGTSDRILSRYANALERVLPVEPAADPQPCVEVTLFDRYPIKSLETLAGQTVVDAGPLDGRYHVRFENGNDIAVASESDLYWLAPNRDKQQAPQLIARLSREEYVARVLNREAAATPLEAAKALAIVARTYLLQNASREGQCLQIKDSSHHQRVAPRPATEAARAVARWSDALILAGTPVTYHQTEPGLNRLSWEQAKQKAAQGWRYDAILADAFPRSNLARWDNPRVTCDPLPDAEQWLQKQIPRWRTTLDMEPGYQEQQRFGVCRLHAGNPHIDRKRRQIYVRGLRTQQDRLDLTHEYLHLAFEAHPNGQNEMFIEALTRRLLLE